MLNISESYYFCKQKIVLCIHKTVYPLRLCIFVSLLANGGIAADTCERANRLRFELYCTVNNRSERNSLSAEDREGRLCDTKGI
mgnify:CR=1 FL=1